MAAGRQVRVGIHRPAIVLLPAGLGKAVVLSVMPGTRTAVVRARSAVASTRSAGPRGKRTMWDGYESPGCWDELLVDKQARYACDGVVRYLGLLGDELAGRQAA